MGWLIWVQLRWNMIFIYQEVIIYMGRAKLTGGRGQRVIEFATKSYTACLFYGPQRAWDTKSLVNKNKKGAYNCLGTTSIRIIFNMRSTWAYFQWDSPRMHFDLPRFVSLLTMISQFFVVQPFWSLHVILKRFFTSKGLGSVSTLLQPPFYRFIKWNKK